LVQARNEVKVQKRFPEEMQLSRRWLYGEAGPVFD
jgi:hypothetical protein